MQRCWTVHVYEGPERFDTGSRSATGVRNSCNLLMTHNYTYKSIVYTVKPGLTLTNLTSYKSIVCTVKPGLILTNLASYNKIQSDNLKPNMIDETQ